ncbi:MAG: D-arabinono-1,4-lactone oxidase [Myxococcota bacterium]
MTGLSRRELGAATAWAGLAGLLTACRPTTTGASKPYAEAFTPGQVLPWTNWGGNQSCLPAQRIAPDSESALVAALAESAGVVRPVGAGHSFSALVPSEGALLSLDLLSGVASVDAATGEAWVWAGTRLHQLGPALHARGQAMPNLPDIDYQALGGAIATSTHGTGKTLGSLSAYITGLRLVTADGSLVECDANQNAELFHAARCSLGALGVVSQVRLRNRAPLELAQVTRTELRDEVLDDVEARIGDNRHFELLALPHTDAVITVTTNERADATGWDEEDPNAVYEVREAFRTFGSLPWVGGWAYRQMIASGLDAIASVRTGPSHQVLCHDRLVRFREMEYTVPAEVGPECLREVLATIESKDIPVVFPIEMRWIAADDVWISPFYERPGCAISVHQFADEDHEAYFAEIEPIFWKYEGRPHWGKLHGLDAARLAPRVPRLRDFAELQREIDPEGRFLNDHLAHVLGRTV